jgi:hypothetical protein
LCCSPNLFFRGTKLTLLSIVIVVSPHYGRTSKRQLNNKSAIVVAEFMHSSSKTAILFDPFLFLFSFTFTFSTMMASIFDRAKDFVIDTLFPRGTTKRVASPLPGSSSAGGKKPRLMVEVADEDDGGGNGGLGSSSPLSPLPPTIVSTNDGGMSVFGDSFACVGGGFGLGSSSPLSPLPPTIVSTNDGGMSVFGDSFACGGGGFNTLGGGGDSGSTTFGGGGGGGFNTLALL